MLSITHENGQNCPVLSLDQALAEGCADAYDWAVQSLEVHDFDKHHPELPSNDELIAKIARPTGSVALSA